MSENLNRKNDQSGAHLMTQKFDTALSLALQAHAGQIRKGTENALGLPLPYITHPVAVATLVQRYGGNEDQVIAALLHDVLEDGGTKWADPIRDAFGGKVLELVQFCTDGLPDALGQRSPWRDRKERYLAHLRAAEGEGVLVSACDKLANLQAILLDLTEIGESVWARFSGGKGGSLWYYTELVEAFGGRLPAALDVALRRDLAAVLQLAEAKNQVV
jgi:(p)ppGpp synthase/HD superfamily hydrolase